MLYKLTILACLAISRATAEPGLEHASFGYGAHMFGGINPELYTTARALAPLQYASSVPMVYAGQLFAGPMHKTIRPMTSAPLQYAASLPVSYAAPASLAYSSPYASHPHAHMSYGGHSTPLAASYEAAAAAHTTPFHNPTQYASYAATPVHSGHILGSAGASSPSSSLHYAATLANAQAYGGSSAYAQQQQQQQHLQQQYLQQQHQQQQQQQQHQQHSQQQSYQQHLDAAFARSAASELYSRGVLPLAYSSPVAASSAGQEVARQMAVQLSSGYHQQQPASASAFGEARAQARADSE